MSVNRQNEKKSGKKTSAAVQSDKKRKQTVGRFIDFCVKSELLSAILWAKKSKAGPNLESMLKADPRLSSVKIERKDIPYWGARFAKGTQAPTFRLYFTPITIATTAGGLIDSAQGITAAGFINFGDFANVFDEYRIIAGEMIYHPSFTPNTVSATLTNLLCLGVIDYGDATLLGSYAVGASYDTKKAFNLMITAADAKVKSVRWPIKFEKLPDQEWSPCSSSATNFAWLKFVTFTATGLNAVSTGVLDGWMDVQFRGSD